MSVNWRASTMWPRLFTTPAEMTVMAGGGGGGRKYEKKETEARNEKAQLLSKKKKKKERRKTVGTYVCARMFACVTDKKNVADKNVSESFLFVLFFFFFSSAFRRR